MRRTSWPIGPDATAVPNRCLGALTCRATRRPTSPQGHVLGKDRQHHAGARVRGGQRAAPVREVAVRRPRQVQGNVSRDRLGTSSTASCVVPHTPPPPPPPPFLSPFPFPYPGLVAFDWLSGYCARREAKGFREHVPRPCAARGPASASTFPEQAADQHS